MTLHCECSRYVTWPGQAVGYKIGQLKIIELRRKVEAALGEAFDIKQFHEVEFFCSWNSSWIFVHLSSVLL